MRDLAFGGVGRQALNVKGSGSIGGKLHGHVVGVVRLPAANGGVVSGGAAGKTVSGATRRGASGSGGSTGRQAVA